MFEGTTPEALLSACDSLLYLAKEQGETGWSAKSFRVYDLVLSSRLRVYTLW